MSVHTIPTAMAYPRKEKVVGVRLDERTYERLVAVARRVRGRTVSAYLVGLLEPALDREAPIEDDDGESAQAA